MNETEHDKINSLCLKMTHDNTDLTACNVSYSTETHYPIITIHLIFDTNVQDCKGYTLNALHDYLVKLGYELDTATYRRMGHHPSMADADLVFRRGHD